MFCDLVGSTALSARLDPEDLQDVIRAYQGRLRHSDLQRAVRTGLGIVEAMAGLNAEVGDARASELAVRIGIATGSPLRHMYTRCPAAEESDLASQSGLRSARRGWPNKKKKKKKVASARIGFANCESSAR